MAHAFHAAQRAHSSTPHVVRLDDIAGARRAGVAARSPHRDSEYETIFVDASEAAWRTEFSLRQTADLAPAAALASARDLCGSTFGKPIRAIEPLVSYSAADWGSRFDTAGAECSGDSLQLALEIV